MKIVWTFDMKDDQFSVKEWAERIYKSAVNSGLPPDKVVIRKIGYGHALYDVLKEYPLLVELSE